MPVEVLITTDGMCMDKQAFGARLRELRMATGLSQLAFAQKAGVSQSRISDWEAGKFAPSATDVPALAEALGCDIVELFKPAATEPEAPRRGRPPKVEPEPAKKQRRNREGRKGE